jgi:diguanylate cyclase (GGDEF)-like protein/PAS domain S-box-containing protein
MKIRDTIFNHLFIRMAVILLGVSMAFSIILTPIYHYKLVRMLAAQGNTFANTAVAACGESLYTGDYGVVVNYIYNVLRETPEITYVNLVSKEGLKLTLTARGWRTENVTPISEEIFGEGEDAFNIKRRGSPDTNSILNDFVFSKPVNISGFDWGVIELGISDTEYNSLLVSYIWNVFLFLVALVLIALLILQGSSKRISQQLERLRETALELSRGNLSARAPVEAVGEIRVLASTLNSMADSLEAETRSARKLARLVEDTHDAIAIFDSDGKMTFVNPALMNITGVSFEQHHGMLLHELLNHLGIDRQTQREVLAGKSYIDNRDWSVDVTMTSKTDDPIHMTLRVEDFYSEGGKKSGFFIVLSDIAHRERLEHALENLAYFDNLTKLPNRRYFMDRLGESVNEADTQKSGLAVFFLDLDNFEVINDTMGHEAGGFVLNEAGWRIQSVLRSDDIVCHLGGDEFTVVVKGVNNKRELGSIAESINSALAKPIKYRDSELSIGTSIGIVCYPEDGHDVKELIKNADAAMFAAKNTDNNAFSFYG